MNFEYENDDLVYVKCLL